MAVLRSLIARWRFGPRTQWRSLRGILTGGLGLNGVFWAWPAVVQPLVSIYFGTLLWPWVLVFVCRGSWFGFCVFALLL